MLKSLVFETVTYLVLYTCVFLHSGILGDKYTDFFSSFTASFYFVVQTSTTAGYGDTLNVSDTTYQLLMILILITSIMFFSYYVSRFKTVMGLLAVSYSSIVMKEEGEMDDWLSIRENDAEKRDIIFQYSNSQVIKKFINTYRSYITHNFAAVQENHFFLKLSSNDQQFIIQNIFLSFIKGFSYLTKTIGRQSMKRLFSSMTIRM